MKLFKLSWVDWDSGLHFLFCHTDETITQERFEEDVKALLLKYGNEYIEQEKSWVGLDSWVQYIALKLSELGYQPVEPINYSLAGGMILDGDNDIEETGLLDIVGKDLCDAAIAKNKITLENLDKGL